MRLKNILYYFLSCFVAFNTCNVSLLAKPLPVDHSNLYLQKINEAMQNALTIKEQKNPSVKSLKKVFFDTIQKMGYSFDETISVYSQKYIDEDYTQMEVFAIGPILTTVFADNHEIARGFLEERLIQPETFSIWEKGYYKRHPAQEPKRAINTPLGIGSMPNVKITGIDRLGNEKRERIIAFIENFFSDADFRAKHTVPNKKLPSFNVDFKKDVTINIASSETFGGRDVKINDILLQLKEIRGEFFFVPHWSTESMGEDIGGLYMSK